MKPREAQDLLRAVLSTLEEVAPAPVHVDVYPVGGLDDARGRCWLEPDGNWTIALLVTGSPQEIIDALLHEWAHVISNCDDGCSWSGGKVVETGCGSHGPEWALAYGEVYSAFTEAWGGRV